MRSSKYVPHQGKREIERRCKQAEKLNAKKTVKVVKKHIPDNLWPQYSAIV